ncbi:MAG: VWA domain-containing protein [Myxococcales bacterium]|nr:VWA domain-containing protein [Myxococcales bacterium]
MPPIAPARLNRWFRRHSLTLVATLGGAAGVAFAVARLGGAAPPAPHAGPPPVALVQPAEAPPRDTVVDTIQVALLLDTSSSMDGLINQARSHLWKMVDQLGRMTRVVDGKVRGVKIELAIFEYGNDTLPEEGGYIRQVLPFTSDLDQASEKLGALFTNGGSEFAGQAIETAVTSLAWSKDPAALRFVFVAGNESFDQGRVSATAAMATAAAKDIAVQLIFCGTNNGDSESLSWGTAAKLAQSDLTTIDQDRVAAHIPAPQDADILRLGGELNGTYMAYGAGGQAAVARQAAADASSVKLGAKVALERNALKAKKAYRNDSWDLVDAVDGDTGFLGRAKDEELPADLRGKSLEEKQAAVAAQASRRAALKAEIARLEAERDAFLKEEATKRGTADAPSLESELIKGTRKAATKKGYNL